MSESEITKERLALEDAIRKVEADAARKARAEQRAPAAPLPRRDRPAADGGRVETRRPEPPCGETAVPSTPAEPATPRGTAQPSARERLLNARAQTSSIKRDGIKGFRDVVSEVHDLGGASAKAAQSARDIRNSYTPPPYPAADDEDESHALNDYASEGDADDLSAEPHGGWQARNRQPSFGHEDEEALHARKAAGRGRTCRRRGPRAIIAG